MKNLIVAIRSILQKDQHNIMKISTLSIGLAVGLVLIAKVCFEQSYDSFYEDSNRIYQIQSEFTKGDLTTKWEGTAGGIAPTLYAEIPEIEKATRFTTFGNWSLTLSDTSNKYDCKVILGDSCLFDIFSRQIRVGNANEILSRPMYALVSSKIANKIGKNAVGKTFTIDEAPGRTITIGGVFEDIPENAHVQYDVVISLASAPAFMWERSPTNLVGNERYYSYVKLYPGVDPESLKEGIQNMIVKNFPVEEIKKSDLKISFKLIPLTHIHSESPSVKRMSWVLSLLAFALIFTAIMNYMLIVISAIVGRSKMVTIRKCYGASEKDIHAIMFSEALLHIFISFLAALCLLVIFRPTVEDLLGVSLATLLLSKSSLLLVLLCGLIVLVTGLVPGYLYARIPVASVFRSFRENKRIWKLTLLSVQFVATGFLLSLLLVIGRQYNYMVQDHPGYTYDNLAYCDLSRMDSTYFQKAADEIKRLPNVAGTSSFYQLPFVATNKFSGNNVYLPDDDRELFNIADLYYVGNSYLELMEIPVIAGSSFTEDIPFSHEIMVDRNFVEKMKVVAGWTDNIIGKSIYITEHSKGENQVFTICGVYENFRLGSISDQDSRPSVLFYTHRPAPILLIKCHQLTNQAMAELQETINRVFPDRSLVVNSFRTEITNRYYDARQFRDSLLIGGIVTLLISLIGLIGYMEDEMSRRRKEIAIRRVNGASIWEIIQMFSTDIARIAIPAVVVGGVIAYYAAEIWLQQFTEKISLNPALFAIAILFVLVVVIACSIYRSYEVANSNPVNNLKSE